MALTCPRCSAAMSTEPARTAEGPPAQVEVCPSCRGLWLDAHVIAQVCPTVSGLSERKLEIQLIGRAGSNVAKCPRCAAVPYEFALLQDLLVDFCPGCAGVWLDGGEYEESVFELRPEAAVPRERSPYRAAAEKAEKKREVLCADCTHPVVVADSFMSERGLVCHRCWASREHRRATLRQVRAEEGSSLLTVFEGLLSLIARPR